jgi:aspartyl-tRNA(Asn)/glutamyl-tRNA(Gln) amidotransferase subunit A
LIIPSHSMFAPSKENLFSGKLAAAENWYCADLLGLANFSGTPSITIPTYKNKENNFGLNINAKRMCDTTLLNAAFTIEKLFE